MKHKWLSNRKKIKDLTFFLKYKRTERIWLSVNDCVDLNHADYKELNKVLNYVPLNMTTETYKVRLNSLVTLFNSRVPEIISGSDTHDANLELLSLFYGISVRKANIIVIKSKPWLETIEYCNKQDCNLFESELISKMSHYVKFKNNLNELYNKSCIVMISKDKPCEHAVKIGDKYEGDVQFPIWRWNYKDKPLPAIDNICNIKHYKSVQALTLFRMAWKDMPNHDIVPHTIVNDDVNKSIGFMYIINPPHNWVKLYMELELNIHKLNEVILTSSTNIGINYGSTIDYSKMHGEAEL